MSRTTGLDRHLDGPRANQEALIWEGEPGDTRTFTYSELHAEVSAFSNALKGLGVVKGDSGHHLPPNGPRSCDRDVGVRADWGDPLGGLRGFSPESLSDRNNDAQAKVLITADGGWRRGGIVPLKANSDTRYGDFADRPARRCCAARWRSERPSRRQYDSGARPLVSRPGLRCCPRLSR